MINGPRGLEFHTTVFTAPSNGSGTATTMDALIFDTTGPVVSMGGNTKSSDGSSQNGKTNLAARYNTTFAANYHTYKVVWGPQWKAWMVDTVVYRNITFTTWRPQSIRQILRTNIGTDGDLTPLPDSAVYIRRVRYTPWSWQAVADALRCTSMAACYGNMPVTYVPGTALGALSVSPGAAAGGRRRLQSLSDDAQRTQLAQTIAATVPGVSASNVDVTITGYAITATVAVEDPAGVLTVDAFTPDMQAAFVGGVGTDLGPSAANVYITRVHNISDYTGDLSTAALRGASTGVVVEFTVDGYAAEADVHEDLMELQGTSGLAVCTERLAASETAYNFAAILASSGQDPSLASTSSFGFSVLGATPSVTLLASDSFATMAVRINVDARHQAGVETAFNNALHSGAFGRALQSSSGLGLSVLPPTPTQSMALARSAQACNIELVEEQKLERKWQSVGIAFIIIAGTSIINLVLFAVYHSRAMARAHANSGLPDAAYVADVVAALKRMPSNTDVKAAAAAVDQAAPRTSSPTSSPTRAQEMLQASQAA
jgi:hypothetical protein